MNMKRIAGLCLFLFAFGILAAQEISVKTSDKPDGKTIFKENCLACHGVLNTRLKATSSRKSWIGPDLSAQNVSRDLDLAGLNILHKEAPPAALNFKGTDEELKALVDWIASQMTE
jgi:mono/diheme cytochrome c family protein